MRTCIGCRTQAPRSSLVRVVNRPQGVVVDESATLPGRGAWLHPRPECFRAALSHRSFSRALRASSGSTDAVEQYASRLAEEDAASEPVS